MTTEARVLDAELLAVAMTEVALNGRRSDVAALVPDDLAEAFDAMVALSMLAASALTATGSPQATLHDIRAALIAKHCTKETDHD